MTTAEEAAAFWGIAQNPYHSTADRLACALAALEYYGGLVEQQEADATETGL
jgi:hypothetical protein